MLERNNRAVQLVETYCNITGSDEVATCFKANRLQAKDGVRNNLNSENNEK